MSAGEVAADKRHGSLGRQLGHARAQAVHKGHIRIGRQGQAHREPHRPRPVGGEIAQVDGKGLPADIFRREIGAPEMHVLHEQIRAHAQRPGNAEHGAVVAAPEQHVRPFVGEMRGDAGEDVIPETRSDIYSSRVRNALRMTLSPKPGKLTRHLSGGSCSTILPRPNTLCRQ